MTARFLRCTTFAKTLLLLHVARCDELLTTIPLLNKQPMTHANRSPIPQYSFRRTPWPITILVPYGLDNTAAGEIPLPFGLPGHLLLGPPGLPDVILLRDVP